MTTLTKNVTLYQGFVIPESDARDLKLNNFEYDTDDECFKGMLETEEGALHAYNYYPTNHLWFSVQDLGEDEY